MVVIFRTQTGSLWYKKETFSIRNGIISQKTQKAPSPDMTIIATYIRCDNLLMESLYRKGGQSDTVKV